MEGNLYARHIIVAIVNSGSRVQRKGHPEVPGKADVPTSLECGGFLQRPGEPHS